MRSRTGPTRYGAPPAGQEAAGPRPDLRGFRLGALALIERPQEQLDARRAHGLVGGFVAGAAAGSILLIVGVVDVVAVLAAGLANLAVFLWLPTVLIAPSDRRLLKVLAQTTAASLLGWRRAYGNAPIPRTEEQQLLWIAAQPDTTTDPDRLSIEGSFLLMLGRYADARNRADRLGDETPWLRFDRALAYAAIDFESGGRGDLAEARSAAEAVHGERRPTALAYLALEEANQTMIRGDDWEPPIARAARVVGPTPIFSALLVLGRARPALPWLLASELALGAALYLGASRIL